MKILMLNPNTNVAMTEALVAQARRVAPPGAEIVAATAPFGPRLLSRRCDIAVSAAAVLAAIAAQQGQVQAAVIGSFSDPGLEAAREVADIPVVGLGEAGVVTTLQLGARIGLLLGSARMIPAIEERMRAYGVAARVVSIRTPPDGVRPGALDEVMRVFGALATEMIERDRVEAVVLGGGRLIGMAAAFNTALTVPVVDSVDCAVLQAYALASLQARKPAVGSYSRPDAVPAVGLDEGLARLCKPAG
jgi:Asp/Glu/hydantoin racemase